MTHPILTKLADLEAKLECTTFDRADFDEFDEEYREYLAASMIALPKLRQALEVAIRFLAIQSKEPTGWTAQCCMDEMTCILDAAAT